jgi:hypothetical protein
MSEEDTRQVVSEEDFQDKGRSNEVLTYLCYAFSPTDLYLGKQPLYQYCPRPVIDEMKGKPKLVHTPQIIDIAFVDEEGKLEAVVEAKDYNWLNYEKVINAINQLERYGSGSDLEKVLVFSHLSDGDIRVMEAVLDQYKKYGSIDFEYCQRSYGEALIEERFRKTYEIVKYNISMLKGNALKVYLEIIEYGIMDAIINSKRTDEAFKDNESRGERIDMSSYCLINFGGKYSVKPRVFKKD